MPFDSRIGRNCDFKTVNSQKFSIPSTIIYYISNNPSSPNGYQKLTQTCKYFYAKNPIIVVYDIRFLGSDDFNLGHRRYRSSIAKIACKFWVTHTVAYHYVNRLANEILHNKVIRITKLQLSSGNIVLDQILSPETLQSIREVYFRKTTFEHADGVPMSVEEIFEYFPNLESFKL